MRRFGMAWEERLFKDRRDAGRRLAAALEASASDDPLVLALPRGGVPVAFEIARALRAELDILLVRKIGAPGQPELAIGAIVDGDPPQTVLTTELVRLVGAGPSYLAQAEKQELDALAHRRGRYRRPRPPATAGRHVILCDDGIATGATVRAAIAGLAAARPSHLTLAAPVCAPDTAEDLDGLVDSLAILATPPDFRAVGLYYEVFGETSDREVIELLEEALSWRPGAEGRA
jgi:putative phosphoribosyl transferase